MSFTNKTTSNEIHIHTLRIPAEFEKKEPSPQELSRILSSTEQKRYQRYLAKRKKVEFFLARKFTKDILGARLNVPIYQIDLQPDASGKPFLFLAGKPFPLYFNISHTSGFITCVISEHKYTGIDIEYATGSRDAVMQRFFHPHEIREYRTLPRSRQERRFYTLWTLKEAYLKAIGSGMRTPLNSFWFSIVDHGKTQTATIHFEDPDNPEAGRRFHFLHLQPTAEHFLAVAVKRDKEVQFISHHHERI